MVVLRNLRIVLKRFELEGMQQVFNVSLEIEKRGKPTLEALKEFQAGKLEFRFRETEQ